MIKKTCKKINIMEVCGTHTMAIARFGLKSLFPKEVNMISGPGCPVCVTPDEDIDKAIALSGKKDVIIATFGDMLRVPGTSSSLEKEKAKGADIRIVYSPMDALGIAKENPAKKIVFLGVGFETTSPAIASTLMHAKKTKAANFFVLSMFKTMPEALSLISGMKGHKIDGFLLPGHVSAIIGARPYKFIPEKYSIPCVIGGFDAGDIVSSVKLLLKQIKSGKPKVEIQYSAVVTNEGNKKAQRMLKEVFIPADSRWRGIGVIRGSGLELNNRYKAFDALKVFDLKTSKSKEAAGCKCGEILLGKTKPSECPLFSKRCTPSNPVGPCMVSSEGACAAEFKYGQSKIVN